ncbi:hypothetical protein D9M72_552650 [compost metagenome]
MDENCLRQFKVAGMKFCLGLAQIPKGRLQSCASHQTVTGNECRGVIMGSEQQFMVEGGGGHEACGVTTGDGALGGQVEGVISVG